MAYTQTLYPPIDSSVEQDNITFDFGPILAPGVSITSVISVSCTAVTNAILDATPSARVLGTAAVVQSPSTLALAGAVVILVGNMIAGVTYLLQVVVGTSDNQKLSLWCRLPCVAPD